MRTFLIFTLFLLGASSSFAEKFSYDAFAFELPERFVAQSLALVDPAGDMVYSRWVSSNKEVVDLLIWPNGPELDRGPMVIKHESPITLSGVKTNVVRTEILFGAESNSLVVHLSHGQADYAVIGDGIEKHKFIEIIYTIKLGL